MIYSLVNVILLSNFHFDYTVYSITSFGAFSLKKNLKRILYETPSSSCIALLAILYKPLLEYKYGATVGKMALKILVVNKDFQKPSLVNVVVRNIFDIVEHAILMGVAIIVFNMPAFKEASALEGFNDLQGTLIDSNLVIWIPIVIVLIEIIFLLTDKQKRALHDRLASTFVLKR